MGLLEKLQFRFFDSGRMIKGLVEEWKPVGCRTEKAYEKSLYAFLHERLEDIQVTKQYAKGRIRADLVVGDEVIIELKNNLNTTAKYQRLVGQISEYKEWDGQILIVLVGSTDPNLRKQLLRYVANDEGNTFATERIAVIEKQGT